MDRRVWVFRTILLSILYIAQLATTELLPKNCTETFGVKISRTATRYGSRQSSTSCGLFGWGRCRVYRRTSSTYVKYEIQSHQRSVCCSGSIPLDDVTCTTTCPQSKYGDDCTQNCTCPQTGKWNLSCDKENGQCSCQDGYHGENCSLECDIGYYGSNCSEKCMCQNNSTCNPINGACNCTIPGWTGQFCERECSNSTYGVKCLLNCNCTMNETCQTDNGDCICKAGLMGEKCDKECSNFMYGEACKQTCHCNRDNSVGCDPKDGKCFCKPGWEGETCSSVCSRSRYGKQCSYNCTCADDEFCDHSNGSCFPYLCHFPTTLNCDHRDDINLCEGLEDFQMTNETAIMEYKLYNICVALEKSKHNMVCLAATECQCHSGYTGMYCNQEIQSDIDNQARKTNNYMTLLITAVSVGILLVVIIFIAVMVCKFRVRSKKRTCGTVDNKTYSLEEFRKNGAVSGVENMNSDYPRSTGIENAAASFEEDSQYDELTRNNQRHMDTIITDNSENTYSHMTSPNIQNNDEYDVASRFTPRNAENTDYGFSDPSFESSEYDVFDRNSKDKRNTDVYSNSQHYNT